MHRLTYGWGINDCGRPVRKTENSIVCICPYYVKWNAVIRRAKCNKLKSKYPSYVDVSICDEWKYFSNFIKWVDTQPNRDWAKCELDKDILFVGNKIYSPETCVFIDHKTNSFLTDRGAARGKCMIGVSLHKNDKRYHARCRNPIVNKDESLGYFLVELDAHLAWKKRKHELACQLADLQVDVRVANALRTRYI